MFEAIDLATGSIATTNTATTVITGKLYLSYTVYTERFCRTYFMEGNSERIFVV